MSARSATAAGATSCGCAEPVAVLVLIAILAVSGRSYYATWHDGPAGSSFYWLTIALSPELLIFAFFMITDPQTRPSRLWRGTSAHVATAVVAAAPILPQPTEFGIKVAIRSSLLLTCALVPAFERLSARIEERRSGRRPTPRPELQPVGAD